jgi:eukaryotic-like serine/threonine-protein kinase
MVAATSRMTAHRENTARTDADGDDEPVSGEETRALPADELPSGSPERSVESLVAGDLVGRYLVLEDLARGGMSIVYVAYDPQLDRRVALKVMRPDANERPEEAQRRLEREATAMARLAHPNVVRVYDVGTIAERVYMAMELVEGQTLRDFMTAKPRRWQELVDVLVRAGRGLAAAHEAGLVHLDFKPRNVLVGKDGEVRVADFGLARSRASTDSVSSSSSSFDADSVPPVSDAVTHAGVVMGTPGYMAPEQLDRAIPDARADQFSFCVTAWEALYGQRPYAGQRLDTYRAALAVGKLVEPPASARVPVWLRRLLERGLAIDPTQRHDSLAALLAGMTRDPWRSWRRVGLVGVVAGGVALATWIVARAPEDPCLEQAERLAGAWDPERREQVRARLVADDAARARPLADEIVDGLDAHAAAWTEVAAEVCRAARAEGRAADDPSDVRSYCLDHRRRALRAATELVLEPNAPADTPWDRVLAELPAVHACRDVTSVHHVGRPPPSEELRRSVERIDEQLARAEALVSAGRPNDALVVLEPAMRVAETTGHGPTLANARLIRAGALVVLERAEEAERAAFEAAWTADVEGMHSLRLEAYGELIMAVGLLGGRAQEADDLGQTGLWLESHVVHDPRARARLLTQMGANDVGAGHYARARDRFLEALELRRTHALEHLDADQATTLQGLGGAYHQLGEHERALATFRRTSELLLTRFGPEHPAMLPAWENEAVALHALERYEEALLVLEQARPHILGVNGSLAPLDGTLGAVLIELQRFEEAGVALERVRSALAVEGVRPVHLTVTEGNLALIDLELGRPAEADARLAVALPQLEAVLGPEHVYCAWLLGLAARAARDRGQARAALQHGAASWKILAAADARGDQLVEPELRAEAALAISWALRDEAVVGDPEAIARWGGERTARAWAELAVQEAERGGRSATLVRERSRRWLAELPP